jgi:uncharacterized protein (UPF0332 family)
MKDETKLWLNYSKENLDSAKILLESKLFNPCLQNILSVMFYLIMNPTLKFVIMVFLSPKMYLII